MTSPLEAALARESASSPALLFIQLFHYALRGNSPCGDGDFSARSFLRPKNPLSERPGYLFHVLSIHERCLRPREVIAPRLGDDHRNPHREGLRRDEAVGLVARYDGEDRGAGKTGQVILPGKLAKLCHLYQDSPAQVQHCP